MSLAITRFFSALGTVGALGAALMTLSTAPALAQAKPGQPLKTGEQVYTQVCAACHGTGVAHAPKFGDRAAWAKLIEEGQPVLTGHALIGVRAMPPKGGNPELSVEEFSRGVVWMAAKAGGNWKDPDAQMLGKIVKEAEKRLDADIQEKRKLKQELEQMARRLDDKSRR